MLLQSRIGDQLSQTAVAAYALPPTAENERAFVLRACRFTLPIAYASLVSPVYREMERRMQIARIGSDESSRRHAERLKLLFSQVKRVAIRGARTIARCLLDIPTMACSLISFPNRLLSLLIFFSHQILLIFTF